MIRDPQYIKLNIEYQNVRYSSIILCIMLSYPCRYLKTISMISPCPEINIRSVNKRHHKNTFNPQKRRLPEWRT